MRLYELRTWDAGLRQLSTSKHSKLSPVTKELNLTKLAMANVVKTSVNFIKNKFYSQQTRFYPRWSHRRPVKVYSPAEYEEVEKKTKATPAPQLQELKQDSVPRAESKRKQFSVFDKYGGSKIKWNGERDSSEPVKYKIKQQKPLSANKQKTQATTTDMLETVLDNEGNFIYTKMADNDARIGTILTEVKSKNEKFKKDLILLEGKRLIKDALQSGCQLKYIIFSRKTDVTDLIPLLPQFGAKLYKMPYREMQMWSDLTTNPGIMGIFKTPNVEVYAPKNPIPLTVICDNVREPGNLGSILRVCAGVGCESVILTKGCVNVWDTKVLRGSMGAHFKLQMQRNVDWVKIESHLRENMGNVYVADNKVLSSDSSDGIDTEAFENILTSLPLLPYYSVNFKDCQKVILIIGGETHGISKESYEIALKLQGVRLNIPLSNEVDSLNVGAAFGIIAFEVKKQLLSVI